MIKQLTKEELLKRVMELPDGTIIDSELQTILMCHDNSTEMIQTLTDLNHMVCSHDNRIRYSVEKPVQIKNDLCDEYVKSRTNVINISLPNVGIKPNDLEHPIEISGAGWALKLAKAGAFSISTSGFMINSIDKNEIFKAIDKIIKEHNWEYSYLYSIVQKSCLSGWGMSTNINPVIYVQITGVTKNGIQLMKNHNPMEDMNIGNYMQANGIFCDIL